MMRLNNLGHAFSEKPLPLFRSMPYRDQLGFQGDGPQFTNGWLGNEASSEFENGSDRCLDPKGLASFERKLCEAPSQWLAIRMPLQDALAGCP
jgi:hypothetical protein